MPARHRPAPRRAGARRLLSAPGPSPRYDRRTFWLVAAPLVVIQVASMVGDAFAPTLLAEAPLLLLALNARLRNLVLAAPTLDVLPFAIVAFVRLVAADPLFFWFGRRYGEYGIRWVDAQAGGSRSVRILERTFRRAAYPVVAVAPNNLVCILAGATGMAWGPFLVLNVGGTVLRLALVRLFTDFFADEILGVVGWVGGNQLWLTALTVTFVAVLVLRGRRGGGRRGAPRPEPRPEPRPGVDDPGPSE